MYWLGSLPVFLYVIVIYFKTYSTTVPEITLEDMDLDVQDWFSRGKMYEVLGRQMFALEEGDLSKETIILIHGFPTSSFDYQRSIGLLSAHYRVVTFDHLGFGFSEKPVSNYTYSLVDQAEQALNLWRIMGIESVAAIVSHDMGDSVLTEILSRYERKLLPDYFDNFFNKIVFTNGGMKYDLINFRLSQSVLMSRVGPYLTSLGSIQELAGVMDGFSVKQLGSIWSSKYNDLDQKQEDIKKIQMINRYKNGNLLTHLTIGYLHDRSRFEMRWMKSLENLNSIQTFLLWGNEDAVAPMSIPLALKENIKDTLVDFRTMETGHFLMLEDPETWANNVLNFLKK